MGAFVLSFHYTSVEELRGPPKSRTLCTDPMQVRVEVRSDLPQVG
jgi:hypothetical protein